METGFLVRSPINDLGIGKLREVSGSKALVEYFVSVGNRIEKLVPTNSLEWVKLQRHTRCYLLLFENQEFWQIGRIYQWHDNRSYEVDLPNGKFCYATEPEIYVRCNCPIEDPTEVLIVKGQETPFFHDRRSAFVRCLIEQRAVSRGMPGLFSANIELYRHQVEVIRRVLEDPIQRYLLADEVGLGKTIEAGVIIRQYLLDEPEGQVLVIASRSLLKQWQQELGTKFYLTDEVQFLAVEDLHTAQVTGKPNFLIVDEAQHVAAMAVSVDFSQRNCFETCKQLAHQAKCILLLSATPALNHEQAFLAMLHLLDPVTYRLEDLDGFKEKVRLRQDIGRVLLSFRETSSNFVLKMSLGKLKNIFAKDLRLTALLDRLQTQFQVPEVDSEEKNSLVRAIRTHISDTYRLHRRMLRNRRDTLEDVLLDQSEVVPKVEYDEDDRSLTVYEYLDEWRIRAVSAGDNLENLYCQQLKQIFLLFFCASSTELSLLAWMITARLSQIAPPKLVQEFGADALQYLTNTPHFSGEAEILQTLSQALEQQPEFGDRIDQLQQVLKSLWRQGSNHPLKVVIFTSFTHTCQKIVSRLKQAFGDKAVSSYQVGQSSDLVEANTLQFRENSQCFVLVCDSSGEEGHNLQFADWMIHFDLPLSLNRLEQRHGRMNRIGRRQLMKYVVFAGADASDSLHDAWFQLLKEGFKIFQESIASLQFYVDRKLPDLEDTLFQLGAYGLLQTVPMVQSEIQAEKISINEQNALDEIDALEENAAQYFNTLENYESQHQEIRRAVEGWVYEALHFRREFQDDCSNDIVSYRPNLNGRRETLVPAKDIYDLFSVHLAAAGTYNRRIALQQTGLTLYRIGHGFIDALAHFVRWDDRGQAFAMWRHEEGWSPEEGMEWIGFRFDYVVETDLTEIAEILQRNRWRQANQTSLARRADALFPPVVETIFLDTHMNVVDDSHLSSILQRPFSKGRKPTHDYNLAKRRLEILDEYISRDTWAMLCRNARNHSEAFLRQRSDFIERCQQYATQAERQLGDRLEQLQLRLERQSQSGDTSLAQEIEIERELKQVLIGGIRHPRIRLDSIGFYIVSGRSPSQNTEEEDEL